MKPVINPRVGDRVRRGPDWNWGNQDKVDSGGDLVPNATGLGTISEIDTVPTCYNCKVQWDSGADTYRYYANESRQDLAYADDVDLLKVLEL
jgi:hypothetical protein